MRGDEKDGYQKVRPVAVTVRDDDVKSGRGAQKVIDHLYAKKIIPMGSAGDVVGFDDGSFEVSILYPFGKKGHQRRKLIIEPEVQESKSMFNEFESALLESSVDPVTGRKMHEWSDLVSYSELSSELKRMVIDGIVNQKNRKFNEYYRRGFESDITKMLVDDLPWAPTEGVSWAYGDAGKILPSYPGSADIDKFLVFYKDIQGVDEVERITIKDIKLIDIAHPDMTENRMERVEIVGLINDTHDGKELVEKLVDAAHADMEKFSDKVNLHFEKKEQEFFTKEKALAWVQDLGKVFPNDAKRIQSMNI